MGRLVPPPPKVALWQKSDGTIYRETQNGWEYLSPLFGEWLEVFNPELDNLKPYPRNINVPEIQLKEINMTEKELKKLTPCWPYHCGWADRQPWYHDWIMFTYKGFTEYGHFIVPFGYN